MQIDLCRNLARAILTLFLVVCFATCNHSESPNVLQIDFPQPAPQQKLLFTARLNNRTSLFTVNRDGSGQKRLTDSTLSVGWRPLWSPDGRQILFSGWQDRHVDVYVIDFDGRNLQNLTPDSLEGDHPRWSPGGDEIVFESNRKIWVMNRDGTNRRNLMPEKTRTGANPDWSPDGKWIVYDTSLEIRTMSRFGLEDSVRSTGSLDFRAIQPNWSPGGEYISYRSVGQIDDALAIIDLEQDTTFFAQGIFPSQGVLGWHPAGHKMLIFSGRNRGNPVEIAWLDISGNRDLIIEPSGAWATCADDCETIFYVDTDPETNRQEIFSITDGQISQVTRNFLHEEVLDVSPFILP